MAYTCIEYTRNDDVGVLRLNRPEALNSFTATMHEEIREVLQRVQGEEPVRCLVLTGNGRGFSAGQDLNDVGVMPGQEEKDVGDIVEKHYNPLIETLMNLQMPVICAVNGIAAGAGASVAMACDIVVAARSASFVLSFSRIGLIPDSGATWNLVKSVGLARAKGLAMLAEKLPAVQAAEWGLIWRCVEDDELMDIALSMAHNLAQQPTRALARIKQAFNASDANDLTEQLALEQKFMQELGRSDDYREGVAAFVEKRKPVFKGV